MSSYSMSTEQVSKISQFFNCIHEAVLHSFV